MAQKYNFYR